MPRYEFSEGSSNKFWEINLSGKSFTTTYGKIGANGQTTIKKFGSDAQAKSEYEKLIAEKVKKGYVAAGGKQATGTAAKGAPVATGPDARNKDLEAAVTANPSDRDAWGIFADWLQEQGDPRGELMALQLANKDKAAKTFIEKHKEYLLGPLAEHVKVHDEGWNNSTSSLRSQTQQKEWQKTHMEAFLWRNGFIHRVRLSHNAYSDEAYKGKTADLLAQVLSHPSGRFVVEFAFQSNGDPNETGFDDVIEVLGKKAPATTRKITFGDNVDQISWHHTGNLNKLWKGVPNLKTLEIETGQFDVGKMVAPNLERAVFITGGLSKACFKHLASAVMPKIKHLEIYFGDENYGANCTVKDVRALLDRSDLSHLEYLGLENAEFQNAIAAAVVGSKVIKRLKTLDLSKGTMTDDGARALADGKASLKHLECLDLSTNFLTKDGIKLVNGICKKVITSGQQKPDVYEDEVNYFVSVSE